MYFNISHMMTSKPGAISLQISVLKMAKISQSGVAKHKPIKSGLQMHAMQFFLEVWQRMGLFMVFNQWHPSLTNAKWGKTYGDATKTKK